MVALVVTVRSSDLMAAELAVVSTPVHVSRPSEAHRGPRLDRHFSWRWTFVPRLGNRGWVRLAYLMTLVVGPWDEYEGAAEASLGFADPISYWQSLERLLL